MYDEPMRGSTRRKPLDEAGLYDHAIRALASRGRSVAEIKRLLRPRAGGDNPEALVDAVVDRLKQQNYLNDRSYAASYSRYRRDNQKLGRMRVVSDLKARGVHGEVIREAVAEAYDETDEEQQARAFLARKRVRRPAGDRDAARIFRMLMRAGFGKRSIIRVLNAWEVDPETLTALESESEGE